MKRASSSNYRGRHFFACPGIGVLILSHLDFEFVSDLDIRISSLCYINSTNSYVRIYKQIITNKPNSPIVHLHLTYLLIMIYTIFTCLTKVKNKPNQTQYKANLSKGQNDANSILTKDYEEICGWGL
jgi:hypothetical protein